MDEGDTRRTTIKQRFAATKANLAGLPSPIRVRLRDNLSTAVVVAGLLVVGAGATWVAFWADQDPKIENADAYPEISGGIVAGVVVSLGILVAEEVREGKRTRRIDAIEKARQEDHDELRDATTLPHRKQETDRLREEFYELQAEYARRLPDRPIDEDAYWGTKDYQNREAVSLLFGRDVLSFDDLELLDRVVRRHRVLSKAVEGFDHSPMKSLVDDLYVRDQRGKYGR